MARTVRLAKRLQRARSARIPRCPILQGFGRREMKMRPEEVTDCVIYQVGSADGVSRTRGHGAVPRQAARVALRHGCEVARRSRRRLRTPPGCSTCRSSAWPAPCTSSVYAAEGLEFISEYYADLDYADDGALIIARERRAVDPKLAAEGALRAVRDGVAMSIRGKELHVRADCICIHSDTPNATAVARAVKSAVAEYLG